jgi:hypothetical protein
MNNLQAPVSSCCRAKNKQGMRERVAALKLRIRKRFPPRYATGFTRYALSAFRFVRRRALENPGQRY